MGWLRRITLALRGLPSLPGTNYTATYYKPKDSRTLLTKHQSSADDQRASVTPSQFLGGAWWVASEKARELGWIV